MKTTVVKKRPAARRKLLRPYGRSRFTIAEIDAGWAKVRKIMQKEAGQPLAIVPSPNKLKTMKLTVTHRKPVQTRRILPRLRGRPDSFTLRQLDEAMKWLRDSKRERKPAHAAPHAK